MAHKIIFNSASVDDAGNFRSVGSFTVFDGDVALGTFATMAEYNDWRAVNDPAGLAAERAASAIERDRADRAEAEYKAHCAAQRAQFVRNPNNPFLPRERS